MEKRKVHAIYFMLGLLGLVLFNYPIVGLLKGKVWWGIPAVLLYFSGVVVLLSVAGFLIAKRSAEKMHD
jgi:hypothetical protein